MIKVTAAAAGQPRHSAAGNEMKVGPVNFARTGRAAMNLAAAGVLIALAAMPWESSAQTEARRSPAASCESLRGLQLSDARVTAATVLVRDPSRVVRVAHCEVTGVKWAFGTEYFKYFVAADSTWDYRRYNLANARRDTRAAARILDATNPKLTAFKARGGKLLLWHGWSDPALNARATIAY